MSEDIQIQGEPAIDANLLAQAEKRAERAYSPHKMINLLALLVLIVFGVVAFEIYEKLRSGEAFATRNETSSDKIVFVIFAISIVIFLWRIMFYGTLFTFVRTKANADPDSYFTLLDAKRRADVKRINDQAAERRAMERQIEDKFNADVAEEIGKRQSLTAAAPPPKQIKPPSRPATYRKGGNSAWRSLLASDPEVAAAARKVRRYGRSYEDKFASAYQILNDKSYLDALTIKFIEQGETEK